MFESNVVVQSGNRRPHSACVLDGNGDSALCRLQAWEWLGVCAGAVVVDGERGVSGCECRDWQASLYRGTGRFSF